MIKASAGGGGKGMRAVFKNDFKKNWERQSRSQAAFGNDDMYIEKLIQEPRHIEIQIIADQYVMYAIYLKEIAQFKEDIRN